LKERGAFVVYLALVLINLLKLLLTIFTGNFIYLATWLLIEVLFLAVYLIKKRSLRKTIVSLIAQTGITISAVRGFLMTPRYSNMYPTNVEIVQVQGRNGGN
jgi:hypothetical protein